MHRYTQALTMHDAGAHEAEGLLLLADTMLRRAATLAVTHPDAASAVVFQLLPTLAR